MEAASASVEVGEPAIQNEVASTVDATEPKTENDIKLKEIQTWWEIPAITHFCSLFKAVFSLADFDIEDLEEALLTSPALGGSTLVLDIICQLLNGCYGRDDIKYYNYDLFLKDAFKQRWQKELGLANPLCDKGYLDLSVRERVEVLHALCDFRLDAEDVADMLKGLSGESLRVEPLGSDAKGCKYWYFHGTRLYRETPPKEEKIKQKRGKKQKIKEEILEDKDADNEDEDASEATGAEAKTKKRKPVFVARPEKGEKEEYVGDLEEVDDGLDNTDAGELMEEEEEAEIDEELQAIMYGSDGIDDDANDRDFKLKSKKGKAAKRKRGSSKSAERLPLSTVSLTSPGGKGRKGSKGRKSKSKEREDGTPDTPSKKRVAKSKKPEAPIATPSRRSRRRGGDDDTDAPQEAMTEQQAKELKRLAIDGFQNILSPRSRTATPESTPSVSRASSEAPSTVVSQLSTVKDETYSVPQQAQPSTSAEPLIESSMEWIVNPPPGAAISRWKSYVTGEEGFLWKKARATKQHNLGKRKANPDFDAVLDKMKEKKNQLSVENDSSIASKRTIGQSSKCEDSSIVGSKGVFLNRNRRLSKQEPENSLQDLSENISGDNHDQSQTETSKENSSVRKDLVEKGDPNKTNDPNDTGQDCNSTHKGDLTETPQTTSDNSNLNQEVPAESDEEEDEANIIDLGDVEMQDEIVDSDHPEEEEIEQVCNPDNTDKPSEDNDKSKSNDNDTSAEEKVTETDLSLLKESSPTIPSAENKETKPISVTTNSAPEIDSVARSDIDLSTSSGLVSIVSVGDQDSMSVDVISDKDSLLDLTNKKSTKSTSSEEENTKSKSIDHLDKTCTAKSSIKVTDIAVEQLDIKKGDTDAETVKPSTDERTNLKQTTDNQSTSSASEASGLKCETKSNSSTKSTSFEECDEVDGAVKGDERKQGGERDIVHCQEGVSSDVTSSIQNSASKSEGKSIQGVNDPINKQSSNHSDKMSDIEKEQGDIEEGEKEAEANLIAKAALLADLEDSNEGSDQASEQSILSRQNSLEQQMNNSESASGLDLNKKVEDSNLVVKKTSTDLEANDESMAVDEITATEDNLNQTSSTNNPQSFVEEKGEVNSDTVSEKGNILSNHVKDISSEASQVNEQASSAESCKVETMKVGQKLEGILSRLKNSSDSSDNLVAQDLSQELESEKSSLLNKVEKDNGKINEKPADTDLLIDKPEVETGDPQVSEDKNVSNEDAEQSLSVENVTENIPKKTELQDRTDLLWSILGDAQAADKDASTSGDSKKSEEGNTNLQQSEQTHDGVCEVTSKSPATEVSVKESNSQDDVTSTKTVNGGCDPKIDMKEKMQKIDIKEELKEELLLPKEDSDFEDDSKIEVKDVKPVPGTTPVEMYPTTLPSHAAFGHWQLVCDSVDDWATLSQQFKETKAPREKKLWRVVTQDFLPEIPTIMANRELAREERRKEMMPKRSSYRLELKKTEEEQMMLKLENEEEKAQREAEAERQIVLREKEEKRLQEEKQRHREERARRVQLREERARLIAAGEEIPPELMNGLKHEEEEGEEVLQGQLEKVLLTIKKNEYSWPFLEAVEEVNTPDFFQVITEPMDLVQIEQRLEERHYHCKEDFDRHMNLVFDNCIQYHGADSDFGFMAENLKGVYERCMRRVFRVYLEPAPPAERRGEIYGGYMGTRKRRHNYREDGSDSEEEESHKKGKIMYPTGKWRTEQGDEEYKQEPEEEEEEEDGDKKDMTPRATWSYRREQYGPDKRPDFVPKAPLPVRRVDLTKFAGATFRMAEPDQDATSRSLPRVVVNEYVKKKPQDVKVPVKTMMPQLKPGMKVVKISKAEYEKLLADKKLTVMSGGAPGAASVVKLTPGMQLKQMAPSATVISSVSKSSLPAALSPSSTSSPLCRMPPSPASSSSFSSPITSPGGVDSLGHWLETRDLPKLPGGRRGRGRGKGSAPGPVQPVDVKERLRLINEKIANKQKTSEYVPVGFENSKLVNGQLIFNCSASKVNNTTTIFGAEHDKYETRVFKKERKSNYSPIQIIRQPEPDSIKRLDDYNGEIHEHFESVHVKNEVKEEIEERIKAEPPSTPSPSIKRVRFNDAVHHSTDKVSEVPSPQTPHPSAPKRSALSSKSSVYDKWKRKAEQTFEDKYNPKDVSDSESPVKKQKRSEVYDSEDEESPLISSPPELHTDSQHTDSPLTDAHSNAQQKTGSLFDDSDEEEEPVDKNQKQCSDKSNGNTENHTDNSTDTPIENSTNSSSEKQTDKNADNPAENTTDNLSIQTNNHEPMDTSNHIDTHSEIQTENHTDNHSDIQTGKHTDIKSDSLKVQTDNVPEQLSPSKSEFYKVLELKEKQPSPKPCTNKLASAPLEGPCLPPAIPPHVLEGDAPGASSPPMLEPVDVLQEGEGEEEMPVLEPDSIFS